jgi:hypothetical protein
LTVAVECLRLFDFEGALRGGRVGLRLCTVVLRQREGTGGRCPMYHEIGTAAGVVWAVLDREGQLTLHALKERSGLSDQIFSMAIGWLAREGKLHFVKEGRVTRVSRAIS